MKRRRLLATTNWALSNRKRVEVLWTSSPYQPPDNQVVLDQRFTE